MATEPSSTAPIGSSSSFVVVHVHSGAVFYEMCDVTRTDGWVRGVLALHDGQDDVGNPDAIPQPSMIELAWPLAEVHAVIAAPRRRDALNMAHLVTQALTRKPAERPEVLGLPVAPGGAVKA